MAAAKKAAPIKKKKKWFTILAPESLGEKVIGETPAYEPTELADRTVSVSIANLLGDMKKQGTYLQFKIIGIEGTKAQTRLEKYELVPSNIKRLVKRGRTKIADSFVVKTQDDIFVRIKPLIITNNLVNKAISTKLRKGVRLFFKEFSHANTFETLTQELIKSNLQKQLREKLTKLYPIRTAEIYMFHREQKNLRETVDEKGTDIVFEKPKDEEDFAEEPAEEQPTDEGQEKEDDSEDDAQDDVQS
ncbi:MAG: hypothetical protein V1725_04310 [archaeon]